MTLAQQNRIAYERNIRAIDDFNPVLVVIHRASLNGEVVGAKLTFKEGNEHYAIALGGDVLRVDGEDYLDTLEDELANWG